MNKAIIYFEVNEQCLKRTGTECFASDTVSYIEADFNLGENWSGFDSVRAVWSNGWETVSTVLDSDGKAIVPTEVLTRRAKVRVNLVGSIANGNELTDRLTTFPIEALDITKKALIDGSETAPITPSQFEQFVANVKADADRAKDARDDAEGIKTEVEGLKSDVVQLKTDTEAIKTETESLVDGFDARVSEALEDISEAKTDALDGISSAKTDALADINSAKTQAVDDVTTEANTQKSAITQLGTAQKDAITDEGTRQIGLVTEEGTDQIEAVQNEGTTQLNAIRTEGGTQITNIEQKGADVLSRIPYFAPIITDTAEGSIASFTDGADDYPMKSVVAQIVPKQSGTGDPSPTNVRSISGYDEVVVEQRGKNLVDVADGNVDITAKITPYFILPKGTYSYSCDAMRTDGGYYRLVLYKENAIAENSSNYSGNTYARRTLTFTLTEDTSVALGLQFLSSYSTINYKNIQLEVGQTATAYEPYHGQSHSISFPSTVYGGEVNVVSGSGKTTMGIKSGQVTGIAPVTYNNIIYGVVTKGTDNKEYGGYNVGKAIASHYKIYGTPSAWDSADNVGKMFAGAQLGNYWVGFSIGTTLEQMQEATAQNIICYELATPTDFTTTPTEIKTLKGNNNIWCDSGDISVEYPADTKLYIDKKINALI